MQQEANYNAAAVVVICMASSSCPHSQPATFFFFHFKGSITLYLASASNEAMREFNFTARSVCFWLTVLHKGEKEDCVIVLENLGQEAEINNQLTGSSRQ